MTKISWRDHVWGWASTPEGISITDYVEVIHDPHAGKREIKPVTRWQRLLAQIGLYTIYPQHTDYTGLKGHIVRFGYYPGSTECGIVFDDNPKEEVNSFMVGRDVKKIPQI